MMDKDFIHNIIFAIGLIMTIGTFGFALGWFGIELYKWFGGLLGL